MDGPWAAQYQKDEQGETVLDEEGNPVLDGEKLNRYQYNGKELTEDLGLNWNDYGARWYDPAIGRWNAMDPLAEEFTSWSPYNYVYNNPLIFIDPDGTFADIYNLEGEHVGSDNVDDDRVFIANTTNSEQLTTEGAAKLIELYDAVNELTSSTIVGGIQLLGITHSKFKNLAGVLYAEGSSTWQEAAGIYSVLENRAKANETTPYIEASSGSGGVYGWSERDKVNDVTARKDYVANAYKGLVQGILNDTDYSGGGYYWHGKDFGISTWRAHKDYYKVGFLFTDSSHDLWNMGSYSPYDAKRQKAKGYSHKFQSTGAHGGTTFMKLTDKWKKSVRYQHKY